MSGQRSHFERGLSNLTIANKVQVTQNGVGVVIIFDDIHIPSEEGTTANSTL